MPDYVWDSVDLMVIERHIALFLPIYVQIVAKGQRTLAIPRAKLFGTVANVIQSSSISWSFPPKANSDYLELTNILTYGVFLITEKSLCLWGLH